ncbi:hypothetical protein D3C80_1793250 [compost metagenome]
MITGGWSRSAFGSCIGCMMYAVLCSLSQALLWLVMVDSKIIYQGRGTRLSGILGNDFRERSG